MTEEVLECSAIKGRFQLQLWKKEATHEERDRERTADSVGDIIQLYCIVVGAIADGDFLKHCVIDPGEGLAAHRGAIIARQRHGCERATCEREESNWLWGVCGRKGMEDSKSGARWTLCAETKACEGAGRGGGVVDQTRKRNAGEIRGAFIWRRVLFVFFILFVSGGGGILVEVAEVAWLTGKGAIFQVFRRRAAHKIGEASKLFKLTEKGGGGKKERKTAFFLNSFLRIRIENLLEECGSECCVIHRTAHLPG